MRAFLASFKKELKRFFTDRRMLIALFLPGVLIFVIYSLMGTVIQSIMSSDAPTADTEYCVYIDNQPQELKVFEQSEGLTITVLDGTSKTSDEKKQEVSDGTVDLYIVYEANFIEKIQSYSPQSGEAAPQVKMYYSSIEERSALMYSYYTSCLNAWETSMVNLFDVNGGADKYDLSNESDIMQTFFSSILPMLLVALLFAGCMAVCTESVAGEKERGTIATVLVTPARRSHFIFGKICALAILSLMSATTSFLGLILSLPKLMGVEFTVMPYGFAEYIFIFLATALIDLFFTVLLTIFSTFAKSTKEATGMSGPLMVIIIVLSLAVSVIPKGQLVWYCIPILNLVMCLSDVVSLTFSLPAFLITFGVSVLIFGLGIWLLVRMFNSEKIMFRR